MAKTYYKYAERDIANYVNWAEISDDINKRLKEEGKLREEKKAEIDKNTQQYLDEISKVPTGIDEQANKTILEFADFSQKGMLDMQRKLKAGDISPRQYLEYSQNLISGVKSYYAAGADYNKYKQETFDRANKRESQQAEIDDRKRFEEFVSFANIKSMIGPDGSVRHVRQKYNEETKQWEPTNDVLSSFDLKNLSQSRHDRFKVEESADKFAKQNAKYKVKEDVAGGYSLTEDARLRKQTYEASKKAYIDAILADPWKVSSILTEEVGGYDYVYDSGQQDGEYKIFRKADPNNPLAGSPVPDFEGEIGKQQKEVARQYLENEIERRVAREETFTPTPKEEEKTPRQATEGELKRADTRKQQANKSNMIAKLYSGNNAEVDSAVKFFYGAENIRKVDRTPSGVDVTMIDSKGNKITKSLSFYADGELIPASDWIMGASRLLIGEDADPEIAKRTAIQTKGSAFNQTYTASSEAKTDQTTTEDPVEVYGSFVKNNVTKLGIGTDTEEKVADNITQQFSKFGFSAEVPWTYGNFIRIKSPNGEVSAEINLDNPSSAQNQIMQFLIQNTEGADAKEKFINLTNLIQSGVIESSGAGGPDYESK